MSNWQSPPSYRDSFDSFPPHPSHMSGAGSAGAGKVLLVLLALGGVLLAVAVGAVFVSFEHFGGPALLDRGEIDSADWEWTEPESPAERRADIHRGFASREVGVGSGELRAIQRFLDDYVRVCSTNDEGGYRRLIDADRFVAQVGRYPTTPYLTLRDKDNIKQDISDSAEIPNQFQRYSLARATISPSGREARLHVFLWDEDDSVFEFRMWLIRRDRRWRLYDWEFVQFDDRRTRHWSLVLAHHDEPGLRAFYDATADIAAADEKMANGDYASAARLIESAASRRVLGELKDDLALRIAYAWARCGRSRDYLRWCRKVGSPQDFPGAFLGQALARQGFGQHRLALEMAQQYESLIGGPAAAETKARSLAALGRYSEAARAWQQLLDHDPDNSDALRRLALLPGSGSETLERYVLRTSAPSKTAESLAPSLADGNHSLSLQTLVALEAKLEPHSARYAALLGIADEASGDYQQAAEHFLDAYRKETDDELRPGRLYRFLNVMLVAHEFVDAYLRCPDKREAFSYLGGMYEEGEYDIPGDDFARIIAAHREALPGDPWLDYYESELLMREKKYEQVVALVDRALERAAQSDDPAEAGSEAGAAAADETGDDGGAIAESGAGSDERGKGEVDADVDADDSADDRAHVLDRLRSQRESALVALGRHLEAYRTAASPDEAFQRIADMCRWQRKIEPLRELVGERRRADPDDPRVDFYDAVVSLLELQYEQAEPLLAGCQAETDDKSLKRRCLYERIDAAAQSGTLPELYEKIGAPKDEFPRFAGRLGHSGKEDELARLIEVARKHGVDSPDVQFHQIDLLWRRKDYAAVAAALTPWSSRSRTSLGDWRRAQLREKLVRSLLRLGRYTEANALARKLSDEEGATLPLLLVVAKAGSIAAASSVVDDYVAANGSYRLDDLYRDEDIGESLRSNHFRALRRRHPPAIAYLPQDEYVLLLARAADYDAASLRAALSGTMGDDLTVEAIPDSTTGSATAANDEAGSPALLVQHAGRRAVVAFAPRPYVSAESAGNLELADPQLEQALRGHAAWVSVVGICADDENDSPLARKIVAALLPQLDCLATYSQRSNSLLLPDRAAEALAADDALAAIDRQGEEAWLERDHSDEARRGKAASHAQHRLGEFTAAFRHRQPDDSFLLCREMVLGPVRRPLWISLERIDRDARGERIFIGSSQTASPLDPRIEAGEPLRLRRYEIADWNFTTGGTTVTGTAKKDAAKQDAAETAK